MSRIATPASQTNSNSLTTSITNSSADLAIGDRVWVGGTKEGVVAFIGKTKFSEGEWIGVILEKPEGKNNGTVQDVCYFTCDDNHGLFSRRSNLKKQPTSGIPSSKTSSVGNLSNSSSTADLRGVQSNTKQKNNNSITESAPQKSTASNSETATSSPMQVSSTGLKIGERVQVSGNRIGILRFVGTTDFAKGEWLGIELDEPTGKNDGTVGDKRYFSCKPNYGVFAPVHKVFRQGAAPPEPPSARKSSIPGFGLKSRSGSQESINSVSSNISSASRSRMRLGVGALPASNSQKTSASTTSAKRNLTSATTKSASQVKSTSATSSTTLALQKVLKEKEEHIEQLLKERDLERSEVARAAVQVEESESRAGTMRLHFEREIEDLRNELDKITQKKDELEKEKKVLTLKYEESKAKVEDLQFQMEEENIDKSTLELIHLQTKTEQDESKIFELEEQLSNEEESRKQLESQLSSLKERYEAEKKRSQDAEEMAILHLERMEEFKTQVADLESQLRQATEKIQDDNTKQQLLEKNEENEILRAKLSELEAKLLHSENRLVNLEEEKQSNQVKSEKHEGVIAELQHQISKLTSSITELENKEQQFVADKNSLEDSLATLKSKNAQLVEQNGRLEGEIAEVMKNSGDYSQQLVSLNDQLRTKTQEIQTVQEELNSNQQKFKRLQEEKTNELHKKDEELKSIREQNDAKSKEYESVISETRNELETAKNRVSRAEENYQQEKQSLISAHNAALAQLTNQIQSREQELAECKTSLTKNTKALQDTEKEIKTLKSELSELEATCRKAESEKVELIQIKRQLMEEKNKLSEEFKQSTSELYSLRDQLTKLNADKEAAVSEKHASQRDYTDIKARHDEVSMRLDKVMADKGVLEESLKRLQEELNQRLENADLSAKEQTVKLQNELEMLSQSLKESRDYTNKLENEKAECLKELNKLKASVAEISELKHERDYLKKEMERVQEINSELEKSGNQSIQQLTSKSDEINLLQERLVKLNKEHETLQEKFERNTGDLEREKRSLEEKLRRLDREKTELEKKQAAGSSTGNMSEVESKLESSEHQIEFLNSIIADLQNKNLYLEKQIKIFMDLDDNINGGDSLSPSTQKKKVIATRFYCDICEVFDQHDTEDCPQQSNLSTHKSHENGGRNVERPFCTTCECFGHTAEECDDEETF